MNEAQQPLEMDDLTGEQREFADIIGIEAYNKLVREWGSDTVYIGNNDGFFKKKRNEQIAQDFLDGWKAKDLARKYGLTYRSIINILRPTRAALKADTNANRGGNKNAEASL